MGVKGRQGKEQSEGEGGGQGRLGSLPQPWPRSCDCPLILALSGSPRCFLLYSVSHARLSGMGERKEAAIRT